MRHLPAEAAPTKAVTRIHLPATAKVQIFSERSKGGAAAALLRSGSQPHGKLIAIPAARMAKCQRAESPTMHKL